VAEAAEGARPRRTLEADGERVVRSTAWSDRFLCRRLWYNGSIAACLAGEERIMTIEITIQVPDTLGRQLQQIPERLPEVLKRGLREILAEDSGPPHDEQTILAVLTSQPTPKQVLVLRPSAELQVHIRPTVSRSI